MRVVRTQGRGGKLTRQMLSDLEQRGAKNTARTMPVVQRIVGDVRKGGDRALRRYATKLDGLAPQQALEITSGGNGTRPGKRRPGRSRLQCRRRPGTFANSPLGKCPSNGAPPMPGLLPDKECGRWAPLDVMYRAGVILCLLPC